MKRNTCFISFKEKVSYKGPSVKTYLAAVLECYRACRCSITVIYLRAGLSISPNITEKNATLL